jgi:RNA polymerase sigma factor (sigma-70 family)
MTSSTIKQTDRQLLERFVADADEDAFAKLVYRHGPMVLGVCRQILRRENDAEDAFQATFLVLSRKADTIRGAEALPNWLYGVARRLATRSKVAIARRHAREVPLVELPTPQRAPATDFEELAPVLHEEIGRLPDKYRIPFVLCYLDGKTNEEAARQLGCPSGTVFSRLARAREQLRGRLRRRGVVITSSVFITTLSTLSQEASATAPPQLATTTVRRAIRFASGKPSGAAKIPNEIRELAEWGVRSFPSRRLQVAVAVAVLLGLFALIGGLVLVLRGGAEKSIAEQLQGTWRMKSMVINGVPAPPLFLQTTLTFQGNRMTLAQATGTFRIDADKNPMHIDWVRPDGTSRGILELRENTLTIAVGLDARPADLAPGPRNSIMVFERAAP